jgi:hypothetical protein
MIEGYVPSTAHRLSGLDRENLAYAKDFARIIIDNILRIRPHDCKYALLGCERLVAPRE